MTHNNNEKTNKNIIITKNNNKLTDNSQILNDISVNTPKNKKTSGHSPGKYVVKKRDDKQKEAVSKKNLNSGSTNANEEEQKDKRNNSLNDKNSFALFIGGLNQRVTKEMLKEEFKDFPSFISAKVCVDMKTKKSLGYGYLNFSNQNDILRLVEKYNYRSLFGCPEIKIMPSLRNTFYRKNIGTNVFFSNLPLHNPQLTTRYFYDTFKVYGRILSCKLDYRKNIGFVYFDNNESAKKVIYEYNEKNFLGNKILCGIHFDKEVRELPDFSQRKQKLDSKIIIKEELNCAGKDIEIQQQYEKQQNEKLQLQIQKYPNQRIQDETFGVKLPHPNSVFVKNLPLYSEEEELLDYFSSIGPIKSIFSSKVYRYKSLWSIITYKNNEDANFALEKFNETNYKDKIIYVTKAQTKPKVIEEKKCDTFIKLSNLSILCSPPYLFHLFKQSFINIESLQLVPSLGAPNTYEAFIRCPTKKDAIIIFQLLNRKLIGTDRISVGWSSVEEYYEPREKKVEFKPEANGVKLDKNKKTNIYNSLWNFSNPNTTNMNMNFNLIKQLNIPDEIMNELKGLNIYEPNAISNLNLIKQDIELREKNILNMLNSQAKRIINIIELPGLIKMEDIQCITDYIFDVFWSKNVEELSRFILNINENTKNQSILHNQVKEATKYLGYW
ncbi:hypothetical protein TBLA_0D04940 [Henningerozyma blattae CBS 6284]|uniref:RRM domain-containing protein n=1 Tax=Henningerozyma blattae (strain ATCC 34711 / CBS 6284 / DSM 70876 / NBRC 10599 / NRRL Y-10934 / UCD 77-7) TaxID=1071380 RepID=I2H3N7_HENB6|nr:hypothetical protein TBLA_0D04940 [Tetrapisispora blattae CBS 6284]CCH60989.1 hypothetical protein TBLA_0D04940 [Tetrapisispora blattae CBS 6284]